MAGKESTMPRRLTGARWVPVAVVLLLAAEVQLVGRAGPGVRVSAARKQKLEPHDRKAMVSTCEELKDALRDKNVDKILVNGSITCTREGWPQPIRLRRNVEVTGNTASLERFESSTAFETVDLLSLSIDWTNVSKAIVAQRGALAYFHDLVFYQEEVGLGSLDFPFFDTRSGATGVFAGIVLVIGSCSQPAEFYRVAVSQVPRPSFLHGEQSVSVLGHDSLLLGDLAVWWPYGNSLWQICNTAIECNLANRTDPIIGEHFGSELVKPTCSTTEDHKTSDDDEQNGE